jgi:hypothetical protein
MPEQANIVVQTRRRDTVPTAMLSLLFILGVISESIMQGPRMPPARPQSADVFAAVWLASSS